MFGFRSGFLNNNRIDNDDSDEDSHHTKSTQPKGKAQTANSAMRERCRWIPVRLHLKERKALRLIESSLSVSDYTTAVDSRTIVSATLTAATTDTANAKRTNAQLNGVCALLGSLIVGMNYEIGQEVVASRDFKQYSETIVLCLELARRYKIMNPERMRTEYGKLIYLLQDSNLPQIQENLEFSCIQPIKTVFSELEHHKIVHLLDDPLIETATQAIVDDKSKSKHELQKLSKAKYKAIDKLAEKYQTSELDTEQIKQLIYSISDNNTYLSESRDVIDAMISLLTSNFKPDRVEKGMSLEIVEGQESSRLTHSHSRQYQYILQSLSLWSIVSENMYRLWCLAEEDLLNPENPYELKDTGQGFQRVQQAPRTYDAMQQLLSSVQEKLDAWVGSSVVHMGDHNVPNALMFIDKYAQVPRILRPIVVTLKHLDSLKSSPAINSYLENAFGGAEKAKKMILRDFFRSAFDGSGADNFFDAGSCIDGRLTSAWNWCSQLPQKPFFPIFRLAGFTGFDGSEGFGGSGKK